MQEDRINFSVHFSMRIAIGADSVPQVRHILTSHPGFSPQDCPSGGTSPLHFACSSGALKVVRFFLEETGCDVNCSSCLFDMSLVHVAAQNGQLEVLKYLHDVGADFHRLDSSGESVLHKAALKGDLSVLEYLVDGCSLEALLLQANHDRLSPFDYFLDLCAKQGHPKQLTEDRGYEAALAKVREFLGCRTEALQLWARRRHLLAAGYFLRRLRLV